MGIYIQKIIIWTIVISSLLPFLYIFICYSTKHSVCSLTEKMCIGAALNIIPFIFSLLYLIYIIRQVDSSISMYIAVLVVYQCITSPLIGIIYFFIILLTDYKLVKSDWRKNSMLIIMLFFGGICSVCYIITAYTLK